jgi:hypothetical protein
MILFPAEYDEISARASCIKGASPAPWRSNVYRGRHLTYQCISVLRSCGEFCVLPFQARPGVYHGRHPSSPPAQMAANAGWGQNLQWHLGIADLRRLPLTAPSFIKIRHRLCAAAVGAKLGWVFVNFRDPNFNDKIDPGRHKCKRRKISPTIHPAGNRS